MTELTETENARLKELNAFLNHCPITKGDAELKEFDTLMVKKWGEGYNIGNT